MEQNTSTFNDIKKGPGFLLWQTGAAWRREVESVLYHSFGLTYSQFIILAGVDDFSKEKKPVSQVEIARFCKTDITMTSQILRKLESKDLTKRKMNPGNEKSKFPVTTKKGSDLIRKAIPLVLEVDKSFFKDTL